MAPPNEEKMSTQTLAPKALAAGRAPAIGAWLARHREAIWVTAVLLLAALAHGINMFGYPYFENDEGTYLSQAWAVSHLGELAPYTYWYDHAPAGWFQLAGWALLTGGYHAFGATVNSGRVLMMLMQVASTLMVYLIVRSAVASAEVGRPRAEARRWLAPAILAASIATLAFALSAYGLYYRRRVLLDNISAFWMLLSILLLVQGQLSLKRVWASAAALGISILSKELTVFLVPVLAALVWYRSHASQRWLGAFGWLAIVGSLVSLYPLMAALKGELFPSGTLLGGSGEHVSLLETLVFQGSRGKDGGLLAADSLFWLMVRRWAMEEPLLLLAGGGAMALSILLTPWRPVAGLLGLSTAMLWLFLGRGGIVIEFYLVPLLPLLAINLGVVIGLLAGALRVRLRRPAALWLAVPLAALVGCAAGTLQGFRGPNYGYRENPFVAWTSTQAHVQGQAVAWIRGNLPPESRMIIDQAMWLDLHSNEGERGPVFPYAHWYWKVDLDPEIRDDMFGNDRANFDYVITTPQLRKDARIEALPLVAEVLVHSTEVASFDTGGWPVEVRQVRELYPGVPTAQVLERSWESYVARFIAGGRVIDPGRDGATTSEGQSYALLRAVYADDRATFDAVWTWTEANLQQPGGLLAWLYGRRDDGADGVIDAGSASDADVDTALALLLASRRWAEPVYEQAAQRMLAGIWEQETALAGGQRVLVAGDWARGHDGRPPVVNPSYLAPYAYRIFAEADPGRPWLELVESSYALLEQLHGDERFGGPKGLLPTWVGLDPETGALVPAENVEGAEQFGYDGLRAPWRLTLDWLWYRDERAKAALGRFQHLRETLEREGRLAAAYGLDGAPLADHESIAMYAGLTPALLFSGGDTIAFQVFEQKLAGVYVEDGSGAYWGDPDNYYDQNWAWLSTALLDGAMGNLWEGDERLDWSRVVIE
jgi:endo-1,4-beta-D-glucanase Y